MVKISWHGPHTEYFSGMTNNSPHGRNLLNWKETHGQDTMAWSTHRTLLSPLGWNLLNWKETHGRDTMAWSTHRILLQNDQEFPTRLKSVKLKRNTWSRDHGMIHTQNTSTKMTKNFPHCWHLLNLKETHGQDTMAWPTHRTLLLNDQGFPTRLTSVKLKRNTWPRYHGMVHTQNTSPEWQRIPHSAEIC